MGHTCVSALKTITPDSVRRWLPFEISDDDLWDYVYNKQLRPAAIPGTAEELMIEQALAREIVRLMVAEVARSRGTLGEGELLPDFRPIIARGRDPDRSAASRHFGDDAARRAATGGHGRTAPRPA